MTAYSHRERGPPRRGLGVNSKRAWNPKFVGPRCQACLRHSKQTNVVALSIHYTSGLRRIHAYVVRHVPAKSSETQQLQVFPSSVIFCIPYSGVGTLKLQVCRM